MYFAFPPYNLNYADKFQKGLGEGVYRWGQGLSSSICNIFSHASFFISPHLSGEPRTGVDPELGGWWNTIDIAGGIVIGCIAINQIGHRSVQVKKKAVISIIYDDITNQTAPCSSTMNTTL